MSATPIQFAVERLQAFDSPGGSGQGVPTKQLEKLIALSAAFVHEMEQGGKGDLICQRFSFVKRKLNSDQVFESLRLDANQAIGAMIHGASPGDIQGTDHPASDELKQMKRRISDCESVLWNIDVVQDDLERLVLLPLNAESRIALEKWRAELSAFVLEDYKGHYLGAWLLYPLSDPH